MPKQTEKTEKTPNEKLASDAIRYMLRQVYERGDLARYMLYTEALAKLLKANEALNGEPAAEVDERLRKGPPGDTSQTEYDRLSARIELLEETIREGGLSVP